MKNKFKKMKGTKASINLIKDKFNSLTNTKLGTCVKPNLHLAILQLTLKSQFAVVPLMTNTV